MRHNQHVLICFDQSTFAVLCVGQCFLFLFLYMPVLWGFEPDFGDGLGYGLGRQHPVQCVKDAALVGFFFYVQS